MPIAECPHCGKTFHADDYYDIAEGDTLDCPNCEEVIHVIFVDHTINVRLSTVKED